MSLETRITAALQRVAVVIRQRGLPAGGAAGQVLTKTSEADYATSWVTPTAGAAGSPDTRLTRQGIWAYTALPEVMSGTLAATSGMLLLTACNVIAARASGATITLNFEVATKGTTLTAGQNLIGLYALSGSTLTRIALSDDQATSWQTAGVKNVSVVLGAAIASTDVVFVGVLAVGTTAPSFRSLVSTWAPNWVTAARNRYQLASQGTLPASLTLAGLTATQVAHGVLLS